MGLGGSFTCLGSRFRVLMTSAGDLGLGRLETMSGGLVSSLTPLVGTVESASRSMRDATASQEFDSRTFCLDCMWS